MTALRRGSYTPTLASEFLITDGAWHHIGVVWDGSHRYLYADGTRIAADTSDIGYLRASNGTLCMGVGHAADATSFFSGLIDDVRMYDVALSAERIEALARWSTWRQDIWSAQRTGSVQQLSALLVVNRALKKVLQSEASPRSFLIKHLWSKCLFEMGR